MLENTTDKHVAELLVQNVLRLEESSFRVEMIPEVGAALVTFSSAAGGWRRTTRTQKPEEAA